jgi:hypothetical protein
MDAPCDACIVTNVLTMWLFLVCCGLRRYHDEQSRTSGDSLVWRPPDVEFHRSIYVDWDAPPKLNETK